MLIRFALPGLKYFCNFPYFVHLIIDFCRRKAVMLMCGLISCLLPSGTSEDVCNVFDI